MMSSLLSSPLVPSPNSSLSSSSLPVSSSSNSLSRLEDPLSPTSSALLVKKFAVPWHSTALHGIDVLKTARYNKGSAFTLAERKALKIEGLLPPFVISQEIQVKRTLEYLNRLKDDLLKYDALIQLSERNEKLFYRIISENLTEFMPIIYTPTVGAACLEFGHLYKNPKGMYITLRDRGRVNEILANWPNSVKVRAIVFTDGERILGLGDLGTFGAGIPIGKLMLYSACAGIDPDSCLPVQIDVGTNNEKLLNDPMYTGLRQKRETGKDYDELIEEFIISAQARFGKYTLLQFEDFANHNASRLLNKFRTKGTIFNDDIQGTAAVAVAGILGSLSLSGKKQIRQHKIIIFGAGSAGIGIANLLAMAMVKENETEQQTNLLSEHEEKNNKNNNKWTLEDARKCIWLVDSKGLVVESRSSQLSAEKLPYAHPFTQLIHLKDIVENIKPTTLIGCAAQANVFTEEILVSLCKFTDRPIVFALSNPTSLSECTAEQAYQWTQGKAIFASGSPFPPVTIGAQIHKPGQCNNSYIFPGLALAIVTTRAKFVSDEQFLIAAIALAKQTSEKDLENGTVFPASLNIRQVSLNIATAVAEQIYAEDNATLWPKPANLYQHLKDAMYDYTYDTFVR